MKKKLSIVIPAKNEEKRIARTLSTYGAFFEAREDEVTPEIIVVINNSSDKTAKVVDEYSQKYPFIKKIETYYASGKGGAVALGFAEARGDYIGYADADGAVPASEIYKLYDFISGTKQSDGVIGIRTSETTKMTFKRRLMSRIYNLQVKILFKLPYSDTQCGAKVFKKQVAKNIGKKLSNTGWAFDVNLLIVARYMNYRIFELPVTWNEKEGSKFSAYEAALMVWFELVTLKILELSHTWNKSISGFLNKKEIPDKSGRKNILIFAWRDIKHPEMGGSEVYVHEIAKRLVNNHNVTLFTGQAANQARTDEIDGVKIIRRGGTFTVYIWAVLYYVLGGLDEDFDFLIDTENGIPFFTPLFSRKPKLMILHHMHKKQWFKQFMFPLAIIGYILELLVMPVVYRKTPIITVSPSTLHELKKSGFNDKRIFLGYNSIPDREGPKVSKSKDPTILYLGRVRPYKRVHIAIKALANLKKEYPNLRLMVGGAGDDIDRLKGIAQRLKVDNRVEFLGFVSDKQKWELMQKAWIFVMPSMKEGWGITIIEAAACGTPALGFNVLGVRDSIRNGSTGLLAEDEKDFEEKLYMMLNSKELRRALGENCVKWYKLFSWDTTAATFETIIDLYSNQKTLLSDKAYPWDLDLRTDTITTLAS